jgi:Ca2+-dependent lipid-binding protein
LVDEMVLKKNVVLELKKAKNLKGVNPNQLSNPYVIVEVYDQKKVVEVFKTKVVDQDLDPKWKESFIVKKLNVKHYLSLKNTSLMLRSY